MIMNNKIDQALQLLKELQQHANEIGVKQLAKAVTVAIEGIVMEIEKDRQAQVPRR